MNFQGKTIIVTGGTRGIGGAISKLFTMRGAKVIATGTDKGITKRRNKRSKIRFLHLDFLEAKSVDLFIQEIKKLNEVDILVNNAGINIIEPIDKLKKENWDKVLQVNLTGPMILIKEISAIMKKRKRGKILNISSIWGVIGKEKRNSYSASKTGLIGLTRTVALDLAPYNILVNSLCPGFTMTDLTKSSLSEREIKSLSDDVPLKRFASVKEIANIAAFLCSDLNTYITGQIIVADGGFTIK